MPLEFVITPQGQRALEVGVLPREGLDEALLTFIEVTGPVTLKDVEIAFPNIPLSRSAGQLLTFRRMGLIEQRET